MAKFWIWHGSQYANIAELSEHVRIWQSSECILGSKYAKILNMVVFWICKSYTGFWLFYNMADYVLIGREYVWICLNLQR